MMRQIKGGIIKETVNKKLNYEELLFLFILTVVKEFYW